MTGKDTHRSATGTIDAHRRWRGGWLEREPPCRSFHTSLPPGQFWTAKNGKELRRRKWVVLRKQETTRGAGRQGAGAGLGTGEGESFNDARMEAIWSQRLRFTGVEAS